MFLGAILAYCLQTNTLQNPTGSGQKHYKEIQTMDEYNAVMRSSKPQILKFYTDSCGACKSMEPVFNNVAKKEKINADFSAVNVEKDTFKDLIDKHSLVAVPTTIFIRSGKTVKTDKGSMTEDDLANQVKNFPKS
jgi:thiol-disulfide isomerase/thioredoxin